MKTRSRFVPAALLLAAGCSFFAFDDKDETFAADKTVTAADLNRVTSHLLAKAPQIRADKETLVATGKKVKLTLSVLAAPDPEYTKNDPDYRYHAYYYWVYVSYGSKDGLLKTMTYLVQKDLKEVLVVDNEKDTFVKVDP
jgi:hypothetical protein